MVCGEWNAAARKGKISSSDREYEANMEERRKHVLIGWATNGLWWSDQYWDTKLLSGETTPKPLTFLGITGTEMSNNARKAALVETLKIMLLT